MPTDAAARPDLRRLLRPGDVGDAARHARQAQLAARRVLHGDPAEHVPEVAERLASVGLNERGRIVVEKPFGRDLESAQELNATLHSVFPEERIFRIDHYLGKESVEDLLVFRFSNTLLEPIWNRRYVRSVQVTMSETIGVEGRGAFYDGVGAIRDVLQNHLLQVVALLAMEPPVGPDADVPAGREGQGAGGDGADRPDERRARPVRRLPRRARRRRPTRRPRRSSPPGSRSTRGDGPGVPWYVRVGKALAADATEAVVEFHSPPRLLFDEAGGPTPGRNLVRFRLGKRDGVTFIAAGEDARRAPRQPGGRHRRRLRRRARRALGCVRATARRRDRRVAPPLRPRRRGRADVGGRAAGARQPRRRSTRTSAARGARRRPTACSTARPGTSPPDGPVGDQPALRTDPAVAEEDRRGRRSVRRLLGRRRGREPDVGDQPHPRGVGEQPVEVRLVDGLDVTVGVPQQERELRRRQPVGGVGVPRPHEVPGGPPSSPSSPPWSSPGSNVSAVSSGMTTTTPPGGSARTPSPSRPAGRPRSACSRPRRARTRRRTSGRGGRAHVALVVGRTPG